MKSFLTTSVIATTVALFVCGSEAKACGMSWSEPTSHFSGTDNQGRVMVTDTIGTLDLGDDLKLPIITPYFPDKDGCIEKKV